MAPSCRDSGTDGSSGFPVDLSGPGRLTIGGPDGVPFHPQKDALLGEERTPDDGDPSGKYLGLVLAEFQDMNTSCKTHTHEKVRYPSCATPCAPSPSILNYILYS